MFPLSALVKIILGLFLMNLLVIFLLDLWFGCLWILYIMILT